MAFEKCSFKQSYRVKKKGVTKETKMIKQTSQCIVQEIGISIQQKCKEMLGDTSMAHLCSVSLQTTASVKGTTRFQKRQSVHDGQHEWLVRIFVKVMKQV